MSHSPAKPLDRTPLAPAAFARVEETPHAEHPLAARLLAWLPFLARLGIIVLAAGLGALALTLVPRYFPPYVEPPAAPVAKAPPAATTEPVVVEPDYASPQAKAERRLAMQKLLATVLALEDDLGRREAGTWARAALLDANARRAEGERAYSEARYAATEAYYRDARRRYEAIAQAAKPHAETLVATGNAALLRGDQPAATQAFTTALAISPDLASAKHGLERAATLDRALAMRAEAEGYEKLGERDRALALYRRVLQLDAEIPGIDEAVTRIEAALAAERHQQAMSAGYAALKSDRLEVARGEFERALKLIPESPEAARALTQVENEITGRRITALSQAAAQHERAERWAEAAQDYRALQALDRSVDAAPGARAASRAALDAALEAAIAEPRKLVDEAERRKAGALLDQARRLGDAGKRLAAQMARLDHEITIAREPVSVAFESDGATDVSLSRGEPLGRFTARTASLLPGRYTATGRRDGCADVRIEFEVIAGKPGQTVSVTCEAQNP
jgi:tetratricopeptide (TPR) repeat protein